MVAYEYFRLSSISATPPSAIKARELGSGTATVYPENKASPVEPLTPFSDRFLGRRGMTMCSQDNPPVPEDGGSPFPSRFTFQPILYNALRSLLA